MSYYVRPDGLHEVSRRINGRRVVFHGHSDAEINRKIKEYKVKEAKGLTFGEVAEAWKAKAYKKLSPTTQYGYDAALKRVRESFSAAYVKTITPEDVDDELTLMGERGYAKKTVRAQLLVYNLVFKFAMLKGYITVNPCAAVSVDPDLPENKRDAASIADEIAIKAAREKYLLPYFILMTGLRRGEAVALQWRDIDFERGYIYVTKSAYAVGNVTYFKEPKTKAGIRIVPLPEQLKEVLKPKAPDKFVFSIDGGKSPLKMSTVQRHMEAFRKATGVSCCLHQLRHSYVTFLFENNISEKDRLAIAGHSTISTSFDYTHVRDPRLKMVSEKINEALKNDEKLHSKP